MIFQALLRFLWPTTVCFIVSHWHSFSAGKQEREEKLPTRFVELLTQTLSLCAVTMPWTVLQCEHDLRDTARLWRGHGLLFTSRSVLTETGIPGKQPQCRKCPWEAWPVVCFPSARVCCYTPCWPGAWWCHVPRLCERKSYAVHPAQVRTCTWWKNHGNVYPTTVWTQERHKQRWPHWLHTLKILVLQLDQHPAEQEFQYLGWRVPILTM